MFSLSVRFSFSLFFHSLITDAGAQERQKNTVRVAHTSLIAFLSFLFSFAWNVLFDSIRKAFSLDVCIQTLREELLEWPHRTFSRPPPPRRWPFLPSCFNPISLGTALSSALARNKFEFEINANLFKHTFSGRSFFPPRSQVNWNKILCIKRTLKFKINPFFGEAFRELNSRDSRCSLFIEFWLRLGFVVWTLGFFSKATT
jgi:hypothetical protein